MKEKETEIKKKILLQFEKEKNIMADYEISFVFMILYIRSLKIKKFNFKFVN